MTKSKTKKAGAKVTGGGAKKSNQENPVFSYIRTEAEAYRSQGVSLTDNWEWKMFEHIKRTFLYKNSKFADGENDGNRPFKNITRPILNVAYRAEGFDVKDIVVFVDDDKNFDKSFFVKKFAHKWGIDNGLDDFIDEMVEGYIDYGLTLVKRVKGKCPEDVPLQRIAFCDQTDIMSGPICELHQMSVSETMDMEGKWNHEAITVAIDKARKGKMVNSANGLEAKTPGKYIEAYELHGTFPETWLNDYEAESLEYTDDTKYSKQIHIVCFYYDEQGNKSGLHFFKGQEKRQIYKAKKRDPIFGRACGFGGVEELFDPQQWTNYSEIQLKEMLDLASLILFQTASENGKTKNVLTDLEKGEVLEHDANKPYSQVAINMPNKQLFDANVDRWNQAAQNIASANEALLGQAPAAGTPFSLQALVVQQGFGIHDYRKGKLASFMGEIYREWILDILVTDMKTGRKWLSSLTLDEMQGLVDNIVNIEAWNMSRKLLVAGQMWSPDQRAQYEQQVRDSFMNDSKKFLELIENELDEIPVDVEVDIAGKQWDLQDRATKLTNIFRQIMQNPQILQMPGMAKLFNEIIEASGFSPIDFSGITAALPAPAPNPAAPAAEAAPAAAPAVAAVGA